MPTDHRTRLAAIRRFDQLVAYLRDEMDWPIAQDSFEDADDLFYDFSPAELGIDPAHAAKIDEIRRLRPLSATQPWGIFFVKFEPKRLPVIALRRILSGVAKKRRASTNSAERRAWAVEDLLFISSYGEGEQRQIAFAHFSQPDEGRDLPTLRVLGWDNLDTALRLDAVARELTEKLSWPDSEDDVEAWRKRWSSAFTLRHREVISTSIGLSGQLAEFARAIRDRIKTALAIEIEGGPLRTLLKAFQESLVHDLDGDGFADMYAQTIAYGLFSARIAHPDRKTVDDFATHMRTNPFLRELMETFLHIGGRKRATGGPGIDFDELGVAEIVQLLDDADMEAILRDFGDRNPLEDPVIHFYEHFLAAFDKRMKVSRGVFYTPRPVVSYIVRSLDDYLRAEFGLKDGLADVATWSEVASRLGLSSIPTGISAEDEFVRILDPATGTGTFLVEAIDLIYATMSAKWLGEGRSQGDIAKLWNDYVPAHLLPRLYGYELLMAPYAIAHLKVSLKLQETGYAFGSDERTRIYLTNSLEPAVDYSGTMTYGVPALAREAEEVAQVKRSQRFTVVLGNPPYAGHSANNQIPWIVDKVYDYKRDFPDLQKPGQAKWLQDDYVKFLRLAEDVVTQSGIGAVGYVTNHGYLDNPTFKGMRKHLVESFGRISLANLHGNSKKRERPPGGGLDENVFDIQQGVAILIGRREVGSRWVEYRDYWGERQEKYQALAESVMGDGSSITISPRRELYLFRPQDARAEEEFNHYVSLRDIMSLAGDPAPGVVTTHDEFAISFSPGEAAAKVEQLLATDSEAEARSIFQLCKQEQWKYADAKRALADGAWRNRIVPILYRPFDVRWTVYDSHVAVHRRERVMRHMLVGRNVGIATTRRVEIDRFEHVLCTRNIMDHHAVSMKEVGYLFPLWLEPASASLLPEVDRTANLSPEFLSRLAGRLGVRAPDGSNITGLLSPERVMAYVVGCLYSPEYRHRYREGLRSEFPRVPLPSSMALFGTLSDIGERLMACQLLESSSMPKPDYSGPDEPVVGTASWADDTIWMSQASRVPPSRGNASDGRLHGVAQEVWQYRVGGYQVCAKWLKDRKGRTLTTDDIAHYQRVVVAISETLRLMGEIDEAIESHGGWPGAFVGT